MASFSQGDVVVVPFPYTDRNTRQRRPALVVSRGGTGESGALLWVTMITSAENRHWTDDVELGAACTDAGLPAPSLVRPAKIATIEARHAERIGHLAQPLLAKVLKAVRGIVG